MATEAVAVRSGKGGKRTPLTTEQREAIMHALTYTPELADAEIAKAVQVSPAKVWQLRKKINPAPLPQVDESGDATERLERLIGQRLPETRLVAEMDKLIADPKTPKSVKATLIRMAIELRGVVTRKERKDAEDKRQGNVYIFAPTQVPLVQAHPVVVGAVGAQPVLTSATLDLEKSTT